MPSFVKWPLPLKWGIFSPDGKIHLNYIYVYLLYTIYYYILYTDLCDLYVFAVDG